MLDVTAPDIVDLEIRDDGKVVWVHVNGQTEFRACQIKQLRITDNRKNSNISDEMVEKAANAIWPLADLSSNEARDELRRDVRRGLEAIS